jgi:tyrosine-protein kinase Etk/Wzc
MNQMYPTNTDAPTTERADESDVVGLHELLSVFLGSWPLILVCLLLALGIGRYILFISPPTYRTDALVQVETMPNAAEVAIGEITQSVAPALPQETEVALLQSRKVLGAVVDRLGLDVRATPKHLELLGQPLGEAVARRHGGEEFGDAPLWLAPFSDPEHAWGGERINVTTFDVPPAYIGRRFELRARSGGEYDLLLSGERLASGRVGEPLRIPPEALGTNATRGIEMFLRELEAKPGTAFEVSKIDPANAIGALKQRLEPSTGRAQGIITIQMTGEDPQEAARTLATILQTYQSQNIERRSEQAEQTLGFLNSQLPELRERVETAEARLNQFRIERGTADLNQETAAILDQSLALERQRTELAQRREEALQRFTSAHPVVVSLNSQIARIDEQLETVNERVSELPEIQQAALALQREVELATTLYTALLNRRQEIEMVRAGTTGSIRVIDTPLVPNGSFAPRPLLIMAVAGVGGLGFGLGLVFVIFMLRTGVDDPAKVESKLGLPSYGSVPWSSIQQRIARRMQNWRSGARERLLFEQEPNSTTIEAVRSLRTALRFAQFDAPDNITMLTSPVPGVGKSFISINLGATMASAGERVIVVDADLRRGYLNKVMGFERAPGLSELISGETTLDEAVRKTEINGLYLLPTGTLPPNPSEMLMTTEFLSALKTLSEHFDQVIIDTPPILAVTEAADIGRHCGTTLLVLRSGAHTLRMIDDTATRLRRAGVRVRGTVFNQVGRNRSSYYGYGYAGGYYTGYQYEYGRRGSEGLLIRPLAHLSQRLRRLYRERLDRKQGH